MKSTPFVVVTSKPFNSQKTGSSGLSWRSSEKPCLKLRVRICTCTQQNFIPQWSGVLSLTPVPCRCLIGSDKAFSSCSCRQNGLGYSSFVAWVGVSLSPLVMLLEDVWHLLPHIVYCLVAVGSGLLILLLPETLNTRLPELIEDIEKPK